MQTKIREVFTWFLLILLTCILGGILVQMWWPVTPVRIDKISVSKSIVSRGEAVYFQFQGEKFLQIPVHVTLELVNGERIALVNYLSNNPIGKLCVKRNIVIPFHIIPGQYQLKWTGVFEVNALRTVTYSAKSDWITVK